MAENKKSFIAYADWLEVFEELDDNEAGRLVKHLFRYVNDLNPEPKDKIVKMCFIPIKNALKRDLSKWASEKENKSIGGRIGNIKRWHKDLYSKYLSKTITLEEAEKIAHNRKPSHTDTKPSHTIASIAVNDSVNVSDSVNVNVSDSVNVKEENKLLLSQVDKSTIDQRDKQHYEIAISFWHLFKSNLLELNISIDAIEKAEFKKWINPIRLLIESDNHTLDEIREVFTFLKEDEFWKQQIQSTAKLRKKDKEGIKYFDKLLIKSRNEQKQQFAAQDHSGVSEDYKKSIRERLLG